MARVAPINLTYNPRTLWFDPGDIEVRKGDPVVVETARGIEFGRAANDVIEVSKSEIKALKSPLKPVKRIASEEDVARAAEQERRSREALPLFKEMVAESGMDMHPVSVEFLLDGDKAVFYFEAEERVDFRELVRKLAARFHVRIDMRQIGVRDEARMVGGLGHCGQELCCKRMGGEFNPVSIRMAKEQDLSLNPQKISGLCGRLMCCLRYEYDAYKEFKSRAPKAGATVQTPEGPAKVCELDVPRETVSLRVEGEKPVRVVLSAFDAPKEGSRPNAVGRDAWEAAKDEAADGYRGDPATFVTSQFTGSDKLAEAGSVRRTSSGGRGGKAKDRTGDDAGRAKQRSSRGGKRSSSASSAQGSAQGGEQRKLRRRRSTKIAAGEAAPVEGRRDEAARSPEPGRARRSRNRSHSVELSPGKGGAPTPGSGAPRGVGKGRKGGSAAGGEASGARRPSEGGRVGGKQRPGQRSSGLARTTSPHEGTVPAPGVDKAAGAAAPKGHAPDGDGSAERSARRRRRRSRKPRPEGQGPSGAASSQSNDD